MGRRELFRNPLAAAVVALGGAAFLAACDFTSAPYDRNVHLLRRLGYGPTDAGLARIRQVGEAAWLDEQFAPATLDLAALNAKLAQLPALSMTAAQLATNYPDGGPGPAWQLQYATLLRAVESPAQLFERMVEFWNDHFNIFLEDHPHEWLKVVDDREVIRANALGKFSDLLVASAQSPAMLLYLDNYISFRNAINENYSREVLELHTVGVDGGYTEADVVALARLLTGWTIDRSNGNFQFVAAKHDPAPVTIMGWTRPSGTAYLSHGVQFLQWLAMRPATARFVSTKIARRFVADDPAPALVDAMASAWLANGSAIRPVIQAMISHPAFTASAGKKYRRPGDYLSFLLRALGASVAVPSSVGQLSALGAFYLPLHHVPFMWDAPNGYPDIEAAWLSAGSDLARWNMVGAVVAKAIPQFTFSLTALQNACAGKNATEIYDIVSNQLVREATTPTGRGFLHKQLGWTDDTRPTNAQIAVAMPVLVMASLCAADAQYR